MRSAYIAKPGGAIAPRPSRSIGATHMQNVNAIAPAAASSDIADIAAPVATVAKAKRAPKAKAAKPATAKAERVAKPDASEAKAAKAIERQANTDATREARKLAADAVKTYYGGNSLPFKAAADRFAPIRLDKPAKRATERQAALLASMLLAGDNIKRDGTFTRGAFVIDGRNVQPETGCLSDMLNRVITYVSGPTDGNGQRDAVYRIDLAKARAEITAHIGGALAKASLARIDALAPAKPAKR